MLSSSAAAGAHNILVQLGPRSRFLGTTASPSAHAAAASAAATAVYFCCGRFSSPGLANSPAAAGKQQLPQLWHVQRGLLHLWCQCLVVVLLLAACRTPRTSRCLPAGAFNRLEHVL
jgi:hypothetical protein